MPGIPGVKVNVPGTPAPPDHSFSGYSLDDTYGALEMLNPYVFSCEETLSAVTVRTRRLWEAQPSGGSGRVHASTARPFSAATCWNGPQSNEYSNATAPG